MWYIRYHRHRRPKPSCCETPYLRCRTFPLEAHDRGVGTITLRAWKASTGKASRVPAKDPALSSRTASTGVGSDPGSQMTSSGTDPDEKLFFELSESSASTGDASVVEQQPSSGETSSRPASTEAVANGRHLEEHLQQSVPDLQRGRPSTEQGPAEPRHTLEPAMQEPEKGFTLPAPRNNRRVSAQSAASDSSGDARENWLADKGAALPSFSGAYHADSESSPSEAAEENTERQPQSLDLVAAMLPLIPSFPEGSAEVRIRVRGIRVPCAGHALATPPYVRASLHPGARSIARTGLPSVVPRSASRASSVSSREGGISVVEHSPAERVVEYVFEGEDGGANGDEHRISLSLGPRAVDMALGEDAGPSPPRIRLEIVSGRSLGWCDLALPEALRRPGSMARKLRVPVWKKGWAHGQAKKHDARGVSLGVGSCAPGHRASQQQDRFVGEIVLDLGVMLSGEPWPSTSETELGALELTTGSIHVEAAKIRIRDTQRGEVGLGAVQHTKLVGVSSELTLGGGEPMLSAFRAGSHGSRWVRESKPGCSGAQDDDAGHGGQVKLTTICAELDILTLRLVPSGAGNNDSSRRGLEQRQRRRGEALMIAVSDINDVFDGRSHWVTMQHDCAGEPFDKQKGTHPAGGEARVLEGGEGGAECRLEVLLRVSVANVTPITHLHEDRRASTGGRSSAAGLMHPHKSDLLSDPLPKERMRVIEPAPNDGAPRSALEAWITSPFNRCAQAIAVLPSQGINSSGIAKAPPKCGIALLNEEGGNTAGYPSQAGPGVLEVGVLAIHGQGQELRPAPNHYRDSSNDRGRDRASSTTFSSPWWVRVTCSNGGGGAGGRSDPISMDSPPGKLATLERGETRRGGPGPAGAPSSHRHDAEGLGSDWTVRWPPRGGVLAKYPVHWTPSQNSLPVVSFEIFRGQVRPPAVYNDTPSIPKRSLFLIFVLKPLWIGSKL